MNILQVKDLKVYFTGSADIVRAVDGVSFAIGKNEVFGLVGESGSGKTLTALSILRLLPEGAEIVGGEAMFQGADLMKCGSEYLIKLRGSKIAIVFQDPSSALNPVFTVGDQLVEAVLAHQKIGKTKAESLSMEFLRKVHIQDPKKVFSDYPHQLSGGTKQRITIAMALINNPELVILDEPTTALDVTIQSQILDLLDEVIERDKLSILFISHDLGIIARMCDKVAVMSRGKIVEQGTRSSVLNNPKEAYTVSLLESVKALA